MNTRERFLAIMNFQPFDRLPILEWANWWKLTLERWRGEGLPEDLRDRYDICRHFGLDIYRSCGFSYAQYLDYLDLFREYAVRAGRMSQQ